MKYPAFKSGYHVRRYFQELYGWLRLRSETQLWRDLAPILQQSSSTGCTFYELHLLFQHIVRNRPSEVLELGAGISTIVLGHAASKVRSTGAPCTVVSMEENVFYFEQLRRLIPTGIAPCIELVLSPTEDRDVGGFIARCYASKPRRAYDFVFIDGPQVPRKRDNPRYLDGDILDAIDWNECAFTAFLDQRNGTRKNLAQLLPWARAQHDILHNFTRIDIPEGSARC